ncbi:MAG: acetate/propionate family kinase [Rhodobacteraceae bacterium]|nr:acetate/propionate family kinase [Paracoccaceae bacterium]
MSRAILVLNAGSSSVKYALHPLAGSEAVLRGQIERIGQGPIHRSADGKTPLDLPGRGDHAAVLDWLMRHLATVSGGLGLAAAGHRVVHGGRHFDGPARIGPAEMRRIRDLAPLAPAHQPHNIAGIEAVARAYPDLPQVACFDTAFHRGQPRLEQLYALPRELTEAGILRYGFHGLSYDYVAGCLPDLLGERAAGRVVVLHLGNGASICGMRNRRSIATSMGFTALDGLMMGRRCGDIDPGVVLHLARQEGMTPDKVETLLGEQSGLLGVSGISSDMRDLLVSDRPEAAEAVDLFILTAARQLGAIAVALGGLDAMVFTGGIGENAAPVRAGIARRFAWLGLELDEAANTAHAATITGAGSAISAHVIRTDEERCIAEQTRALLSESP